MFTSRNNPAAVAAVSDRHWLPFVAAVYDRRSLLSATNQETSNLPTVTDRCRRTRLPLATRHPPSASRAFTLIEVVVALTILAMITGTLFAIIQGSVRAAAQIEQLQRENDSINRLLDVLRKSFTTMPSTATITLTPAEQSASGQQEILITGAPNTLGFGPKPISYSPTTLSLRPDLQGRTDEAGNPLYSLSLSREDLIPQTDDNNMALGVELDGVLAQDEQGRHWMPLLPDVSTLLWRFYRQRDDTWYEEWSRTEWPDLIEIQLLMRDRTTPIRMVFGVPVIALSPGRTTTTPPTSIQAPSTSGAGAPPAGGASTGPTTPGGSR